MNMKDLMEDFTKDLNNGSDDGLNKILWYYSMNDYNLSTKFCFLNIVLFLYGCFDLKISFVIILLLAYFYLNTHENYFSCSLRMLFMHS